MDITVRVVNQELRVATPFMSLISGTQNFIKFRFLFFDDDWEGLTTFAQFTQGENSYNLYLDSDDSLYLPPEITEGTCTLMLYGSGTTAPNNMTANDTIRATSNAIKLKIGKNMLVEDASSIELTQTLYDQLLATMKKMVGHPFVASTASVMTDTGKVYIYTGTESGYTSGNWYYYDGTAWTSGGVYNAVAIETDTTLSVSGKAADAKKVGDELSSLKEDLNNQIAKYNAYNMIPQRNDSATTNGITFTANDGGGYTISGTATDHAYYRLFDSSNSLPFGMQAGETYKLQIDGCNGLVSLQWYDYTSNGITEMKWSASADRVFTISNDAIGARIRLCVSQGTEITTPIVVEPVVMSARSNTEIQGNIKELTHSVSDLLFTDYALSYEIGTINTASGGSSIATNRIYDKDFIEDTGFVFANVSSGASIGLRFYSDDSVSSYVGYDQQFYSGLVNISELVRQHNATYFRFIAKYDNDADVTNINDLISHISISGTVLNFKKKDEIHSAILDLKHSISDLLFSTSTLSFEIGTISTVHGGSSTATNRIYDKDFIEDTGFIFVNVSNGASIGLRFYSAANVASYIGYDQQFYSGLINISDLMEQHGAKYFRFIVKYDNDADVTDIDDLVSHVSIGGVVPSFRKEEEFVLDLEPGNYNVPSPRYSESTTRCRHKNLIQIDDQVAVNADAGYYYTVREFDAHKNYIGYKDWITGKTSYDRSKNPNLAYILIAFKDSNDSVMTEAKMHEIATHVHITTINYVDERKYKILLSSPVMEQGISDNQVIAPTLCSVKLKNELGKQPTPVGWLFRDNAEPYNFYWSSDGINKKFLFAWDKSVTDTGERAPYEYSIGVTYEGDVICVYRGELAYSQGAADADLRKNPIVYKHGDYSNPVSVDFSNSVAPPTSWAMSCGFYAENGVVYLCEYTRFHHDYSYVWKVNSPYYNPSNWQVLKSFQVSGNQQGFKHCHNIEKDPYTGILWLTTGDVPPTDPQYVGTPGIYYSTDNGATWTTLFEGSEKYCRQLNFVWTEDYVYWASDSSTYETHFFIRARRDANGIIDMDTAEDLFQFFTRSATYHACYSEKPHGILCLERMDNATLDPINFYFWDIEQNKMLIIDRCDAIGSGCTGFRVEAINHYPAPNFDGYLCGFSLCPNNLDMPGNKYNANFYTSGYSHDDADNVGCLNNVLIKIEPR